MLVGFSGPSCSGKTTLVKELSRCVDCGVVEEAVRTVFDRWKGSGYTSLDEIRRECPDDFQLDVLIEHVRKEDAALQRFNLVLCDRTVYDILYYALMYGKDVGKIGKMIELIRSREERIKYDAIFLCAPLEFETDGFRPPSEVYERPVQEFVIERLVPRNTPVIRLQRMPIRERVSRVLEFLGLEKTLKSF